MKVSRVQMSVMIVRPLSPTVDVIYVYTKYDSNAQNIRPRMFRVFRRQNFPQGVKNPINLSMPPTERPPPSLGECRARRFGAIAHKDAQRLS